MNNEQRMKKAVDKLIKKIAESFGCYEEEVIFADTTGEYVFYLRYDEDEHYIAIVRWYEYESLLIAEVNADYCDFKSIGDDEPESIAALKDRITNILSAEI